MTSVVVFGNERKMLIFILFIILSFFYFSMVFTISESMPGKK